MIGGSSAMRMVYFHIDQVADSKTTVLIRGETGVGKERIAQAVWQGGSRSQKSFVRVNCAALPESIIYLRRFRRPRLRTRFRKERCRNRSTR
jgi:Nif-specific regulatory protein